LTKCDIELELLDESLEKTKIDGPITLGAHTVKLPELKAGKAYNVAVTATNSAGSHASTIRLGEEED
jgi:hypothetical protein